MGPLADAHGLVRITEVIGDPRSSFSAPTLHPRAAWAGTAGGRRSVVQVDPTLRRRAATALAWWSSVKTIPG